MNNTVEYLLDTDHAIELVNNNEALQERIEELGIEKFAISEITLAEMSVRFEKTKIAKYGKQIAFLEEYFKILPFDAHRQYGSLRAVLEKKGQRLDDMDVLIAATALQKDIVLLSGNIRHFERIKNLKLENFK